MQTQKYTVAGSGRWGSFLAWYCDKAGQQTTLLGRKGSENFAALCRTRQNAYLQFPPSIRLTDDDTALRDADRVIISVGAQNLRDYLTRERVAYLQDKPVILCMKGLEENSGKRLTQVAIEQGLQAENLAVWVGPGHIQEFLRGVPNCMLLDSISPSLTRMLADELGAGCIRFYYGDDLIGTEVGAALKNVIGIAAGMLDGLGFTSLKGALMARSVQEVGRLIRAMGGKERSAYGLAHLGDYEATLFSEHSHNRAFGMARVTGKPFDRLAEGYMTSAAAMLLADRYGVDMPISRCVYRILFCDADPMTELAALFDRTRRTQFDTQSE